MQEDEETPDLSAAASPLDSLSDKFLASCDKLIQLSHQLFRTSLLLDSRGSVQDWKGLPEGQMEKES